MANIFDTALGRWRAFTTADLANSGSGNQTPTVDRELVVTTYVVKTAFGGASIGDTITCTQIIDVSGASPSTVSTVWRNQTTAADLASAPSAANLTLTGAGAATEATASATSAAVGAQADSAAGSDGTGNYGIISALKRGLLNWAALLSRLPSSLGPKTAAQSLPVTLSTDGTFAQAFGTTGDAAANTDTGQASHIGLLKRLLSVKLGDLIAGRSPVDTLGQPTIARQLAVSSVTANQALTSTCRRISIRARGCPMRYEIGVGSQTASATTSHLIEQDERLDLSVPAGANIAAIAIPPWGSSTTGTGSLAISELG